MSRVIWKYPLALHLVSDFGNGVRGYDVEMPWGARILSIQSQDGTPTLWAMVQPGGAKEHRRILVCGTGHEADFFERAEFIGTVQCGPLVWHFFEDRQ